MKNEENGSSLTHADDINVNYYIKQNPILPGNFNKHHMKTNLKQTSY